MSHGNGSPYWYQVLHPVAAALQERVGRPGLIGLHGATAAFTLSLLTSRPLDRSWLIVAASDEDAERLYEDLRFFSTMLGLSTEPLALFPEWETLPYESTPPHVELIARRMRTLHRLAARAATVLVSSVPALLQRLL